MSYLKVDNMIQIELKNIFIVIIYLINRHLLPICLFYCDVL